MFSTSALLTLIVLVRQQLIDAEFCSRQPTKAIFRPASRLPCCVGALEDCSTNFAAANTHKCAAARHDNDNSAFITHRSDFETYLQHSARDRVLHFCFQFVKSATTLLSCLASFLCRVMASFLCLVATDVCSTVRRSFSAYSYNRLLAFFSTLHAAVTQPFPMRNP